MAPAAPSLDLATAALLGALQGVAEFLPISSSGHLSLAQTWLQVDPSAGGHTFNIVVHAGTLLAVLLVYRRDLIELLVEGVAEDPEAPERTSQARRTLLALFVGCLPLGIVLLPGVEDLLVSLEQRPRAVGVALIVTAAILTFSHRKSPPEDEAEAPPTIVQALLIGLAQLCAVVPGISRSGSTIAAALGLGHGRARAARFSFLLSIPAIGAASAKELLDVVQAPATGAAATPLPFIVGFVVSFGVGVVALSGLLRLLERFGMLPFVPYLLLVGTAAIVFGG